MKIAVVAANGRVARKVITEALGRGIDVTAFVRGENNTDAKKFVVKDIFDLTTDDLKGFDVVVDAFGAWKPELLSQHSTTLAHLCDILKGTETRLVIVGGAGSLYVNPEHTVQVIDTPDFPEEFKPLAGAQVKQLAELRARKDVRWTYISPAGDFQADGERTGKYLLGGEELTLNSKGESIISYADYAIGMVDEIEKGNHIQQRISLVRA
ncbi:MAG: NAD(P)-dependent oxidoreductase [Selenomonas sp.]|uniref:NAD(P)-dependent oxidoreductase n=1 Tax=Selenomonas sp. TaxID=2053611 RepID=UPI0025D1557C|nr:NAD(P)-dependent oxidoreductase [Selenomonas sp.]MCI6084701.1 NAD(P)-dependent oxidoreductase [Selenomonas sp.]MDY4416152.1 NAD(P)-dependent oxidoreductase [Selenomonas sp.]